MRRRKYSELSLTASASLPRLSPRELAVDQLVNASRILAWHGIADDGPGHISVRDPLSPNTTFLLTAGSGTPAQITPADIAVVRINDSVVIGAALSNFTPPIRPAEVFIHSAIYQRFPNSTVNSIAYYRAQQLLPWSLYPDTTSNVTVSSAGPDFSAFLPVYQGAAFLGPYGAPTFSIIESEPNTTSAAINNVVKGHALATAMGPVGANISTVTEANGYRPLVLMRNDGATVSGTTVPEVVFRFIAAVKNAEIYSSMIATIGTASTNGATPYFLPGTATRMSDNYLRSWLLWMTEIESDMLTDQRRRSELWGTVLQTNFASSAATVSLSFRESLINCLAVTVLLSIGICL